MKILIPGSFDPPTNGHIDVIKRSSSVFDEVIVGVVVNPQKKSMFDVNQRENMLIEILKDYKQLIALRHQYPALRTGKYKTVYAGENLYAFARILEDREIIVAVNTGKEQAEVVSTIARLQFEPQEVVYGAGRLEWHNTTEAKKLELVVPAKSSMIVV